MNFRLLFSISKTHIWSRKKQSLIAALGVTFGIGTYIIMMGFMNGLNGLLDGLILNRTPHIHLYNEIQPSKTQPVDLYPAFQGKEKIVSSIKPKVIQSKIHNALPMMDFLSKQSYVKGVTAQVKAQSFYLGGSIQLNGLLIGINVQKENELYRLEDYIVEGTVLDLVQNENGILLGAGVAKKLSFQVGDIIQVATKNNGIQALKIVGLYQSGMADVDNVQSYVNIKMAQRLMGQSDDFITDINVKLKDMNQAPTLAVKMEEIFEVRAVDIQTANAQFETGSSIRTLISYAVSITLLIVAGFGIYNILNMLIYQKMNDIAILKATGFSGRDVKYIFISQAIIIGFIGGVLGLLLGFFVTRIIDNTPFNTAALPTIKTFPVVYDVKYYIIGMTFAMLSTFFAGYFPSRKAEKIDPVDIIRGQ
ncbi:MAG: ABC transporter permease [Crocinitomicaceae bacterium]|nr:ABC transporter permease [Crocinitomicaceae bacterium]